MGCCDCSAGWKIRYSHPPCALPAHGGCRIRRSAEIGELREHGEYRRRQVQRFGGGLAVGQPRLAARLGEALRECSTQLLLAEAKRKRSIAAEYKRLLDKS